jgi:D-alanyl-D-alanine carboxypeptidase
VDSTYFAFVNDNPRYQWTRDGQIKRTVAIGAPLAEAGEQFKYGDINYLLLTEVIEKQTGKPFYIAIRELINYQSHGLNATWFVNLEAKPTELPNMAHQYWGKYEWDSHDLNPSWDLYGGGGIASTVKDAARFYQTLFEGKIITDKVLLDQMTTFVLPNEQSNYCLGLRVIHFLGETTGYYHGGFWGTDVMYLPEHNATIAVFTLQRDERGINAHISKRFIQILKR